MADSELVSSTTQFVEELDKLHDNGMADFNEAAAKDINVSDIVDLVGGAQDAIDRHKATSHADVIPKEFTETSFTPDLEPVVVPEPEPTVVPEPEPVVPEPEPEIAPPTPVVEDATEQLIPDSTVAEKEPEEVARVVPAAEPVRTEPVPEPVPTAEPVHTVPEPEPEPVVPEPVPEPAPEPVTAPAEPPTAAPLLPTAPEKDAAAPASYEPFLPSAPSQLLMQFPTALGQRGDCPAPISPLSPLHSPDSLEELSLSESPNQPPTTASAPFRPSPEPPKVLSSDMPWRGEEEGNARFGPSKNDQDVAKESATIRFESEADAYCSSVRDLGPESLREDSGVSFSPEEKHSCSGMSTSPSQSPISPQMIPESHIEPASSNPTEHWDSPFLASQDNSRASMDTFSKDTAHVGSSGVEPDMLSRSDDDLMFEAKKNPFQGFSPVADAGFSHFGDTSSENRASKMSDSPTPDLVQYGQGGDSQDSPPSFYDETKTYESVKFAADSLMQPLGQFSLAPKEGEDSALLPDILKSSPLNPEKLDSGSSEGSPEQSPEQSPVLERKLLDSPNIPFSLSATNPFAFESKVSLLKEMTEETEAKSTTKGEDNCFGAFDLVKEAETTPLNREEPVQVEQKDWFSSRDSSKMANKLEPLNFQSQRDQEDSDSESPTADSLSPVLEAMAKNPSIFQVEMEKDTGVEEADAGDEVSEPEVSSEEFEFIERPPRGVIDEFLEALDNSKFAKGPELGMDDDLVFGQKETVPTNVSSVVYEEEEEEAPSSQGSYLLLTQPSTMASPQKAMATLEEADIEEPLSQAPLLHSPLLKPETLSVDTVAPKPAQMPSMSAKAVVDLLYWRDVKTTGVVFGASLLLLLSLTVCSIVSVLSYVGLALLSVTISFRIYKGILQAIQKSDEGHPFKLYLDQEVALSEDVVHSYSDVALARINKTVGDLRRLFLVEDLIDSLKFAVLMWILTYVGALFNGLTLIILGLVGMFSGPIIYEKHQTQIDHYLALVNNQIKDIVAKIQAKVPGLKRKAE